MAGLQIDGPLVNADPKDIEDINENAVGGSLARHIFSAKHAPRNLRERIGRHSPLPVARGLGKTHFQAATEPLSTLKSRLAETRSVSCPSSGAFNPVSHLRLPADAD